MAVCVLECVIPVDTPHLKVDPGQFVTVRYDESLTFPIGVVTMYGIEALQVLGQHPNHFKVRESPDPPSGPSAKRLRKLHGISHLQLMESEPEAAEGPEAES